MTNTGITIDHLDIIGRAVQSLNAMARFVDDNDDIVAAGTACILMRIADDLDQVDRESHAARRAAMEAKP